MNGKGDRDRMSGRTDYRYNLGELLENKKKQRLAEALEITGGHVKGKKTRGV